MKSFFCRVRFPFTDAEGTKVRSALVIDDSSPDGDLDLLMVTSQSRHPDALPILDADYACGRLPLPSWVRLQRPLRIHRSCVQQLGVQVTGVCLARIRKALALAETREFSRLSHAAHRPGDDPARPAFEPTQTIPYAGRVFTEDEVEAAVAATLDFWLTLGPEGEAFEKELASFLGVKHSLLVNSGSSANLVAISALTTHKLPDHKRIQPGDEVITAAAGFPTTVAPIIQVGAVPVFIDANPLTGNADCSQLEAAYSPGKTKAVMMAHALGNPFDLASVLAFCQKHDIWLIEDNCDALGCTYTLPLALARSLGLDRLIKIAEKGDHPIIRIAPSDSGVRPLTSDLFLTAPTGAFGDLSTQSFYPPHHITLGEGGAVNIIRKLALKSIAESFRDWGRDCWCPSGKDNTCAKRFGWQLGELPEGYDHKYIYSHLGYNLKPLDIQAAIGRVQLRRLPSFIEARKRNWETLRQDLAGLEDYFDFALPTHATKWNQPGSASPSRSSGIGPPASDFCWDATQCRSSCSWFGFMMLVKPAAPFTRRDLAQALDAAGIGHRMLFGGNLVRQPAFAQLRKDRPEAIRIVGELKGADRILNEAIFVGTHPGLTEPMLERIVETVTDFAGKT